MTNNLIINAIKRFQLHLSYSMYDKFHNVMGESVCSVVTMTTWMSDYTINYCISSQQCYNSLLLWYSVASWCVVEGKLLCSITKTFHITYHCSSYSQYEYISRYIHYLHANHMPIQGWRKLFYIGRAIKYAKTYVKAEIDILCKAC